MAYDYSKFSLSPRPHYEHVSLAVMTCDNAHVSLSSSPGVTQVTSSLTDDFDLNY